MRPASPPPTGQPLTTGTATARGTPLPAGAHGHAGLEQVRRPCRGFVHGRLTLIQAIQNRRVRTREFAAPVLSRLQQTSGAPATQRLLTHAEVKAGVTGRGPGGGQRRMHRQTGSWIDAHPWAGHAPVPRPECVEGYRDQPCPTPSTPSIPAHRWCAQRAHGCWPPHRTTGALRTSCAQQPRLNTKKGSSKSSRTPAVEGIGATGFEPAT